MSRLGVRAARCGKLCGRIELAIKRLVLKDRVDQIEERFMAHSFVEHWLETRGEPTMRRRGPAV